MAKADPSREAIREAVENGDMTPQQAAKELGGGIAQWAADFFDGK